MEALRIEVRLRWECHALREEAVEPREEDPINVRCDTLLLDVESDDGVKAQERVKVMPLGDDRYKVLLSPGFFQGIAAGDEIKLAHEPPRVDILARGGNVCVQCFHQSVSMEALDELKRGISQLGGRVDGELENLVVLTIPVSAGFEAIESVMANLPDQGVEWMYGNVYDPDSGEPLGWWE
ncbi:DUF4265 domain-containing protein [Streptomyces sp. A012304]|uniref:DUF4265 domain-containing protein n=1 Tax=Streptomyces sp. A012304 TaxID=375446 RepID=UPI0022322402|nr:DUF4265 domain-containing protein [Streptomyces sp. A012304]GKQ37231.1 hypothetical protein ALMP_37690 [Streptomyces sp. A012304]